MTAIAGRGQKIATAVAAGRSRRSRFPVRQGHRARAWGRQKTIRERALAKPAPAPAPKRRGGRTRYVRHQRGGLGGPFPSQAYVARSWLIGAAGLRLTL